jgi:hypothetical protein
MPSAKRTLGYTRDRRLLISHRLFFSENALAFFERSVIGPSSLRDEEDLRTAGARRLGRAFAHEARVCGDTGEMCRRARRGLGLGKTISRRKPEHPQSKEWGR